MPRTAPRIRARTATAATVLVALLASSVSAANAATAPAAETHTFLLSADTGAPRPGHAPVPLMRPDVTGTPIDDIGIPLAGALAGGAGLTMPDHAAPARTWYADRALRDDATVDGALAVRLHLGPEVQPDAWLVVTFGAEALDGTHRALGQATVRLDLVATDHVVNLALDADGAAVAAGEVLTLTVEVDGVGGVQWFRYGSNDVASGIQRLVLVPRDTDGDGRTDSEERRRGSNPFVAEPAGGPGAGTTRAGEAERDGDRDGLSNAAEAAIGSDPNRADSDGDGAPDGIEHRHNGDPLDAGVAPPDADGDGLPDAFERANRLDPTNADTDGDGIEDGAADPDQDGLDNRGEANHGTDPRNPDTDEDGLSDGLEVARGTDPLVPQVDHALVAGRSVAAAIGITAASAAVGAHGMTGPSATRASVRRQRVGPGLLVVQAALFVGFWGTTWTGRADRLGLILALQATVLLVQVGLQGLSLLYGQSRPRQQAPSVAC